MSHRASALSAPFVPILAVLLLASSLAIAEEPVPTDRLAPPEVVTIRVERDASGTPTGIDVTPRSAIICVSPSKHCSDVLVWRIDRSDDLALRSTDAIRIVYVPVEGQLYLPRLFGGDPLELTVDQPELRPVRGELPPGTIHFVSWFYNVELYEERNDEPTVRIDPRVVVDPTR